VNDINRPPAVNDMNKPAVNDKIITIGKRNPNLPFHPGVRAGDFIYISGQVAKDENGNMCSGNIEEETRWTLESIRRILQLDGADLSDVVKVTVYLADARNFGRYNKVFGDYFPDGRVSRTTVEARAVIECKIEMDAVAYKPRLNP
jgi:2-iminobutanoate/2-iminopropanoate deaminase